jgi:acetyl/propionyl-CoA carboxylase alpha subunit
LRADRALPAAPSDQLLKKILIANRGEIAVRIIRTCRDMGIAAVAVYSQCDRNALHVRLADEAYAIGPDQASESYLRIDRLIDVARQSGADAVHPGYGFLAENPGFATACAAARLTFIGPTPQAMEAMGSKTGARQMAMRAGVPVVPGTETPFSAAIADRELVAAAAAIGYPFLVKAVAGGGGKGMRVVRAEQELARRSDTTRCISSGCWSGRATSKCSCSGISTERSCLSSSVNVRSSGGIRS